MLSETQIARAVQKRRSLLLAPAIAVLNRLKYSQKFALISLLFALPLALASYFMISELNIRYDFGDKEIDGDAYLRPMRSLLEDVPEARCFSQEVTGGKIVARPELIRKQAEIEADFRALEIAERRLGAKLDSGDKFKVISNNWQFLHEKTLKLDASVSDELYRDLIADIRDLISHVGDTSNLILDPDLDSYYLMDSVLLKLPEGADLLGQLRLFTAAIAQRGSLAPDDKAELIRRVGLIKSTFDNTRQGLEVAFKNNPGGKLKPNLGRPVDETAVAAGAYVEAIGRTMIATGSVAEAAQLDALAGKALTATFDLWDRSVTQLDDLLRVRIDAFSRRKQLAITVIVSVLAVLFYLFVGFNRAVMSTVASLEDASQRMVRGDLGGTVTLDTRDELGQVASSFNTVATRLRTEWAQAREESAKARAAEALLRESEERTRSIVDGALDAVVTMDAEDRITGWNPQAENVFGWSRADAHGKKLSQLILAPRHREAHVSGMKQFFAAGQSDLMNKRIEISAIHRKGHEFPVELAISPLKTGDTWSFSAFVRDITERKQAERALQHQTSLVKLLQVVAVAANEAANTDAALQVGVDKVCDATGWPVGHAYVLAEDNPDLMIPTKIWNLKDPRRYAELRALTEETRYARGLGMPGRVLASGEPQWIQEMTMDTTLPRARLMISLGIKAGFAFPVVVGARVVAVLEFFSTVATQPNEALTRVMVHIGTQLGRVFERKRGESALRKAEEQYRSIFENAIEGIFQMLPDGRYLNANPSLARIYGYDSPQALVQAFGHTDIRFYVEAGRRQEFLERMASAGAVADFESQIYRPDDSKIWIAEKAHAVRDADNRVLFYEGSVEDITERKRAEVELRVAMDAADAANTAKSQFLATMSHELRTPLNAIIGYSEMLMEEAEDIGQASFVTDLQRIHSAGKHLLALINNILDLSKIEAGKMELYLESFELEHMTHDVVTTIQPLVEKNHNRLEVTCPAGLGAMRADLTRIRQCLFNLLSNACKFTENGAIRLVMERVARDGAERIRMSVADSGIGMTEEQRKKLFQAFSQADASTTKKYGGTGLGLAISRKFCQMMGGDIQVESVPGKGSTFTIDLPAEVRDPKAEAETAAGPALHQPSAPAGAEDGRNRILVIDDDPTVHDLMRRILTREGFQVVAAASGEEGLRLVRETKPVAITLDVVMPGMDGWAVLATLKADPELAKIPVIMVTMVDNQNMGYTLGVADYLTKPIDRVHLAHVLQKFRCANPPCRVLVVEDDPAAREMMVRLLEKDGWIAATAENGRIGLERLQEEVPALILLDLMMPEMDGFEFLRRIQVREEWRRVPVVVVTAKELTAEDRAELNGHVQKILQKGAYPVDELMREIGRQVRACAHLTPGAVHAAPPA